jgi:predicted small secreted protein
MRILAAVVLGSALLTGCSTPAPTGTAVCPEASALIGGYLYAGGVPASADEAGAAFAVVQCRRDCADLWPSSSPTCTTSGRYG